MITKIISGGQTGADRGGLDAGVELGLELGGWCPAGYRSDDVDGRIPEQYARYLTPTLARSYTPRTQLNVGGSDGTVILSFEHELTGGSLQTMVSAKKQRKPCLHVLLTRPTAAVGNPRMRVRELALEERAWLPQFREVLGTASSEDRFRQWLARSKIQVLNVAGPRTRKAPGIQEASRAFLVGALGEQLTQ